MRGYFLGSRRLQRCGSLNLQAHLQPMPPYSRCPAISPPVSPPSQCLEAARKAPALLRSAPWQLLLTGAPAVQLHWERCRKFRRLLPTTGDQTTSWRPAPAAPTLVLCARTVPPQLPCPAWLPRERRALPSLYQP